MAKFNPYMLLVEGKTDKWVVIQFMAKFIPWGESDEPGKWPVDIISAGNVETLLESGFIEGKLKISGLKALGVIVDANSNPAGRWQAIRNRVSKFYPAFPEALPSEGLVIEADEAPRFGFWLMPDCSSMGMIETFLAQFADNRDDGIWPFLDAHCREAKSRFQVPFKDVHMDKALIHSWLALQDEPGQQLHEAIVQTTLKPESPSAAPFVNWFRRLYRV